MGRTFFLFHAKFLNLTRLGIFVRNQKILPLGTGSIKHGFFKSSTAIFLHVFCLYISNYLSHVIFFLSFIWSPSQCTRVCVYHWYFNRWKRCMYATNDITNMAFFFLFLLVITKVVNNNFFADSWRSSTPLKYIIHLHFFIAYILIQFISTLTKWILKIDVT